jgi:glucose-6-phosphate isomerase
LLEILETRNYSLVVISKSGTTTEPAIAFRILRNHLEKKIGREAAASRIIAITDASKGALKKLADVNGYETFIIPDNIGGRYSVLTPVGLLPIAIAGLSIHELVNGASDMMQITRNNHDASSNPALIYAAARNLILQTERPVEIFTSFSSRLHYLGEWWKQLYGESEGKEGKGIFPASVDFTTDLHSLGQYIQEGRRMVFETMIAVRSPRKNVSIPLEKDDSDQLNYIAGSRLSQVNNNAQTGTILAHNDGDVPIILLTIPEISGYYIGQLIYFFELAYAVSGYILDINPFDQPGVEVYKKNMFALLNKPGYEEAAKKIREKLA